MLMLLDVNFPHEPFNAAVRAGTVGGTFSGGEIWATADGAVAGSHGRWRPFIPGWRMRARLAVCHVGRRTADRERRVTQGWEPLVGEGREFG